GVKGEVEFPEAGHEGHQDQKHEGAAKPEPKKQKGGTLAAGAKPQAGEIALKYSQTLWEPEEAGCAVEGVDFDAEAMTKNAADPTGEQEAGASISVTLKLKNGQSAKGQLNLFKVEKNKEGLPFDINVGVI